MRGLKQRIIDTPRYRELVASFTDASIETKPVIFAMSELIVASFTDAWIETHYPEVDREAGKRWSHLLQMRGLKHTLKSFTITLEVASFTDAWIETYNNPSAVMSRLVASFTDAWIETADNTEEYQPPFSRIFYRCVD